MKKKREKLFLILDDFYRCNIDDDHCSDIVELLF